jgi:hypothetical protein
MKAHVMMAAYIIQKRKNVLKINVTMLMRVVVLMIVFGILKMV